MQWDAFFMLLDSLMAQQMPSSERGKLTKEQAKRLGSLDRLDEFVSEVADAILDDYDEDE
jgi:hypothetical protein